MEIIRSRQNPVVKQLIKLADNRRERLSLRQTILIGTHLIQAARDNNWPIERLYVREDCESRAEIKTLLDERFASATLLAADLFDAIEQLPSTTGIIALASIPLTQEPKSTGLCLLLDGIQDPGNVGSIMRTAAAAGVNQIWLTTGAADAWSPKVIRAAMGAHFVVPIIERIDLESAVSGFKGPLAITTLDDATSLYKTDLTGNLILAMGSEGQGVSEAVNALAALKIKIPMQPNVESLNVGAATAVCLFERLRQLQA